MKLTSAKTWTFIAVAFLLTTAVAFTVGNAPELAANFGISSAAANSLADKFNTITTVAQAASLIGTFTGVGTVGSGLAAAALAIFKKWGAAKLAAF